MTPEQSGETSIETTAKELGFNNADAMVAAAKRSKAQDAYDGRDSKRIREMQAEITELKTKKHEVDLGIGDDADETSKRLAREILDLKSTVSTLTTRLATTPEDKELEPFYDQVLTDFPEVKDVKDPIRRMNMARRLARQLKTEQENPDASGGGGDVSVAHLTGGDSPVSHRTRLNEEQALARYRSELASVKGPAKDAINAKYRALFPEWGI